MRLKMNEFIGKIIFSGLVMMVVVGVGIVWIQQSLIKAIARLSEL